MCCFFCLLQNFYNRLVQKYPLYLISINFQTGCCTSSIVHKLNYIHYNIYQLFLGLDIRHNMYEVFQDIGLFHFVFVVCCITQSTKHYIIYKSLVPIHKMFSDLIVVEVLVLYYYTFD